MNNVRLLNTTGTQRKILSNILMTDDGKEYDVSKPRYIKVVIDYLDEVKPMSKLQSFENAQNTLAQRLIDDFKFDAKYKNAIFDGKSKNLNKNATTRLLNYCEDCRKSDKFESMLLYGLESWGTGKTHSINAIANKWFLNPKTKITVNEYNDLIIEYSGISYHQIREEDLLLKITNSYRKENREDGENELDIYDNLNRYDILAIDDIGKYQPSNLEFYRRVMFQIIDTRYNQNKGLILSTNFKKTDLLKLFGMAIADRLDEMTENYQVEFKGESNRVK